MYRFFVSKIYALYQKPAPATGVGLFRLLFGVVTLQEVLFLIYFNHLIFDPIPFMDVEFPMIVCFLWLWAAVAACIVVGFRCQQALMANYLFWLIFVNFTPMQRDFDGGFDVFMTGANFFLLFMPTDRAFSLDALRRKLAQPFTHYSSYSTPQVSALAYFLPVFVCMGWLYFDSVIHKMFAPQWRNGLGPWLPSSIPFYVSALDLSWLLNIEWLQKTIGYTIIAFQWTFMFLFSFKKLRPIYFLVGCSLHLGIMLSFNIYPFGMGMLSFYALIMPFAWYRKIGDWLMAKKAVLTVFYDEQCPLCNRTVLILNHFDVFKRVDFKGAQSFARHYAALDALDESLLLTDLYALESSKEDEEPRIYAGVETYAHILIAMRWTAILGWLLLAPGIKQVASARYRQIADNRQRGICTKELCSVATASAATTVYDGLFAPAVNGKRVSQQIAKVLVLLGVFQLNSSIHYGIIYRLHIDTHQSASVNALSGASNALIMFSHTFFGITPHALYLHDHFEGYDRLIGIAYTDDSGEC